MQIKLKQIAMCSALGALAFICQQQGLAQVSATSPALVADIPGRVKGESRSGLIIRLLWFEAADPSKSGVIEQLQLPVGAPYGSQEIRRIMPLGKGEFKKDKYDNHLYLFKTPLVVPTGRPILLGYLAEVTQYNNACITAPVKEAPEALADRATFLKDDPEFDINNPLVQGIVRTLKEDNPPPEVLMRRVWDYINKHLKYGGVHRPNTGAEVLQWGKGLCGEYARATTTLLRGCGIPSREVHSVYCNPEGLSSGDHGWSEAYLPEMGWIPLGVSARIPDRSAYGYTPWCRYITYRGLSVWNVQRYQAKGVTKIGYYGMGRFASMSADECTRTATFMARLLADDGRSAPMFLAEIPNLPNNMQPLLFWLLSASGNETVGRNAAAKLHQRLAGTTNSTSEWETYMNNSPKIAWRRLSLSADKPTGNGSLIKVDAASKVGTFLGSFKKGQTIVLQYVEGAWTLSTDASPSWPVLSPDEMGNKVHRFYRTALRLYDATKKESSKVIPGGTRTTPFSYRLDNDYDIWIACNDAVVGNRVNNNKGTAVYRFTVK